LGSGKLFLAPKTSGAAAKISAAAGQTSHAALGNKEGEKFSGQASSPTTRKKEKII
jgi:hypothetical protein